MAPRASAANGDFAASSSVVTPQIAAEAAVWVARLHGPDRSPLMDKECLAWQARSAANRMAFERCTDTWQDVAGISIADAFAAAAKNASSNAAGRARRSARATRWTLAATVAIVASIAAMWLQPWHEGGTYATGVGEQRVVVLDDGTRMSLNTDTQVRVALGASDRVVAIEHGEALFEVAKDAKRPFVVRASSSEVVAVGTVFAVRFTDRDTRRKALVVTLIEGQVSVRSAARGGGGSTPASRRSGRCRCARGNG